MIYIYEYTYVYKMCILCEDRNIDLSDGTTFAIASATSSNHIKCMTVLWNYNPSYGDLYICAKLVCSIEAVRLIYEWSRKFNPNPKTIISAMKTQSEKIGNIECLQFLDSVKSL